MKNWTSTYFLGAACLALAAPVHAQNQGAAAPSSFAVTATTFPNCLKRIIQMGMMTKISAVAFKDGFAKSCKTEEARFRVEGIKEAVRQGRTEVQAAAEVD